jgi:hypothetical protein
MISRESSDLELLFMGVSGGVSGGERYLTVYESLRISGLDLIRISWK